MIYIFNAKDCLMYPVMKECFGLTDDDIYKTIEEEFRVLNKRLSEKGIDYKKLKGALIPNQEKKKFETCLVIDTAKIEDCAYGHFVFDKLIRLLDKDSTYSILCGDYIDTIYREQRFQERLYDALKEVLIPCNNSLYQHSEQYFLIYINRLTKQQLSRIVDGLRQYDWFTGFAEVDNHSFFKSYISNILVHSYIKMGSCVIGAHPSDYSDAENINMLGYPFEENGFSFISINEDSYGPFLSYKIETSFGNEEDVGFSFNALFPKFNSIQKISLKLDEDKWVKYLCNVERDKAEIIQKLGFGIEDKEAFVKTVYDKICSNYIYNLELNEHNILKFNVCIELPTISGNFRKTMISLKYFPEIGEISIITVT